MFERPHHQRIAGVLEALDAAVLAQHRCFFGGGTAIALRYGEYRESIDIDFLVSHVPGYRALRQMLTGPASVQALARRGAGLHALREVRADQYGIRTLLGVEGGEIKFGIVLEARIALEAPQPEDQVCGVASLTPLDLATSKLLANSDRWADDGAFSRDLIDLAMMQPPGTLLRRARDKAREAYGDSIDADLRRAIDQLRTRPARLERCMLALGMNLPKAVLWQRIKALMPR